MTTEQKAAAIEQARHYAWAVEQCVNGVDLEVDFGSVWDDSASIEHGPGAIDASSRYRIKSKSVTVPWSQDTLPTDGPIWVREKGIHMARQIIGITSYGAMLGGIVGTLAWETMLEERERCDMSGLNLIGPCGIESEAK